MGRIKPETKKTVFFIVEGNTDKTALERVFRKIYSHKNIRFEFTNGDITSDNNITKDNALEIIYSKVKTYIQDNKLKKSDIWQIVQIFDMDGAYIPDSAIVKGTTSEFFYSLNDISCKYPQKIIDRNNQKREMMDYLLEQTSIHDIPYTGYFMSCNLDHALYNQLNLDDEQKKAYADAFYEMFEGQEIKFIDYLNTDVVNGVPNSFPASWRYIKERNGNSLGRHTNLHVYFLQNPYL